MKNEQEAQARWIDARWIREDLAQAVFDAASQHGATVSQDHGEAILKDEPERLVDFVG